MKKETPKGFTCETCGTFHKYALYVYAHTRDIITHTCDCGAKHNIIMLHASQIKKGKKQKDRA